MITARPKITKAMSVGIPRHPRQPIDFKHPQALLPLSFCLIMSFNLCPDIPFNLAIKMFCTSVIAVCNSEDVTVKPLEEQVISILVFSGSITDSDILNVGVLTPLGRENTYVPNSLHTTFLPTIKFSGYTLKRYSIHSFT